MQWGGRKNWGMWQLTTEGLVDTDIGAIENISRDETDPSKTFGYSATKMTQRVRRTRERSGTPETAHDDIGR